MGWSEWKKFGAEKYDLGTSTTTWDIPALIEVGTLPSNIDYTKLTTDDFIVGMVSAGEVGTSSASANCRASADKINTFTHTYNENTGVLTVSGNKQTIRLQNASDSYKTLASKSLTFTCRAWLVC